MGFVQFKGAQGSGASISATLTSAPTNGNLLIAFATSLSGGEVIGSGWTNITIQGESTLDGCWAYKVAGASESTTQTPYTQTSGIFTVGIWEFTGVSSTNDGFVVTQSAAATPPTVTLTATPGTASDYALVGAAINEASSGTATITQGGTGITIDGSNSAINGAVWGHLNSAPSGSQSYVVTFGSGTGNKVATGGLLFLKASSTGSTGTLSETLGATTLSGSANVVVTASGSNTLGALASSASGQIEVSAGAAIALGPATLASAAQITDSASLSVTLGSAGLSGAAHVIDTASLGITLGITTLTATGTTTNASVGSLNEVLGSLSVNGVAESIGTAMLSEAFGAMQCSAQASVIGSGSLGVNLGAVTLQGIGGAVATGPQIIVPLNLQTSYTLEMPLATQISIPLSLQTEYKLNMNLE